MELDERKLKILKAIISNYLETGEPVGSRTISKYTDLNLSSATIRNEMSDLEELGYIASYWGESGAGARRRYYTITPAGQEACGKLLDEWKETKDIMDKLLEVEEES